MSNRGMERIVRVAHSHEKAARVVARADTAALSIEERISLVHALRRAWYGDARVDAPPGGFPSVTPEPRFTKDLDVLVEATLANARRLHAALVEFGFGAVAPDPAELAKRGPCWLLGRAPNRIDILTEIVGVEFRSAWARSFTRGSTNDDEGCP